MMEKRWDKPYGELRVTIELVGHTKTLDSREIQIAMDEQWSPEPGYLGELETATDELIDRYLDSFG